MISDVHFLLTKIFIIIASLLGGKVKLVFGLKIFEAIVCESVTCSSRHFLSSLLYGFFSTTGTRCISHVRSPLSRANSSSLVHFLPPSSQPTILCSEEMTLLEFKHRLWYHIKSSINSKVKKLIDCNKFYFNHFTFLSWRLGRIWINQVRVCLV